MISRHCNIYYVYLCMICLLVENDRFKIPILCMIVMQDLQICFALACYSFSARVDLGLLVRHEIFIEDLRLDIYFLL